MAFKITEKRVHVEDDEACALGLQNEITAICDEASDLTALGTNYYPMSVAVVASPFTIYFLNASRQWVEKTSGDGRIV